jgi:hypothetical protein
MVFRRDLLVGIFHAGGPDRVIDFDFTLTAKTVVKIGV